MNATLPSVRLLLVEWNKKTAETLQLFVEATED